MAYTASKKHGTLHIGVTNDLVGRVYEHKTKAVPGFATAMASTNCSCSRFTMTPQVQLPWRRAQQMAAGPEDAADRGAESGTG